MKPRTGYCIVLGLLACAASAKAETKAEPSIYDKIWNNAKLVDNKDAAVLQKFELVGRLQGDAVSFRSEDTSYDDFTWRRFRFGFKTQFLHDFLLHVESDFDMNNADSGSWDEFYGRLTDAYVGWTPSKAATVKLGKQSAGFTLDGATSSTKLITPERSIVTENLWFPTEYFSGATVSGDLDGWSYTAGEYSASGEQELGHFDSGWFTLLSAGHKVGDKGTLRLDYVYNDPDYSSNSQYNDPTKKSVGVGTKNIEHVLALVYQQMATEKCGIWADIAGAKGISDAAYGIHQSDLVGIDIMPFYNINDNFQLVVQYAGVSSLDGQSDVSMSRYASRNAKAKVSAAHNLLLGFNWYLYGHKLKWQNAVEYCHGSDLAGTSNDYNGYGLTSALRISW